MFYVAHERRSRRWSGQTVPTATQRPCTLGDSFGTNSPHVLGLTRVILEQLACYPAKGADAPLACQAFGSFAIRELLVVTYDAVCSTRSFGECPTR